MLYQEKEGQEHLCDLVGDIEHTPAEVKAIRTFRVKEEPKKKGAKK
jgi:hypothetical protein